MRSSTASVLERMYEEQRRARLDFTAVPFCWGRVFWGRTAFPHTPAALGALLAAVRRGSGSFLTQLGTNTGRQCCCALTALPYLLLGVLQIVVLVFSFIAMQVKKNVSNRWSEEAGYRWCTHRVH